MNFSKIKSQQLLLDQAIKEAHNIDHQPWVEMIIALYTEVAEFANEVQSFKYWKKSKKVDRDLMLEEYADGLHFLMSFGIEKNISDEIEPIIISQDVNHQILSMFSEIHLLKDNDSRDQIERLIGIYLGIASLLKISDQDIENAYLSKNKKNFLRIKNNY